MEIIDNPQNYHIILEKAISRFGYAPEHNIDYFEYSSEIGQNPVVANWPDGSCIMAHRDEEGWYFFSEPLALKHLAASKIIELASSF